MARLLAFLAALLLAASAEGAAPTIRAGPVEAVDDRGAAVRLPAPPARVVSLAPSLTEIVYLLGRGEALVGVTRFCNVPPEATRLPKVGGIVDPDVERIVAARPDLVLCTVDGNPKDRVRVLEEAGIPCFAAGPQDLAGIVATVRTVGRLLGVPERGEAEAARLAERARRAAVRPSAAGPAPSALFVLSVRPVVAAGPGTFLDELLRLSGARNAAAAFRVRYPRLSTEDLLALRPDLVFVAAMAGSETLPPEVTEWREIPAFRDGEVRSLDGDLVTRPGPRLIDALESVAAAVDAWRARRGAAAGASP